jgi:voltage-gated potassium channel
MKLPAINISGMPADVTHNRIKNAIIDVLDGDLWTSKVSVAGNSILILAIFLSTAEYLISNSTYMSEFSTFSFIIKWSAGLLFVVEVLLRLYYARFLGYGQNVLAPFFYAFSFIGIIDILTIIPFIFDIADIRFPESVAAVRILRLWRIVRYIPAFQSISEAFQSKKEEIFVTLLAVVLLSLSLSAVMFHYEQAAGSNAFRSILEVFVWSIGKYTGDYGSIAQASPVSLMGKFIATANGLLGIALFAIPAGLLASAFIDQLAERRKLEDIGKRKEKIEELFRDSSGGGKHFKYRAHWRNLSMDTLQSKLLLSEDEIFETIRLAESLRFRAMKSGPTALYNDTRIIEWSDVNTSYGYRSINKLSRLFLVNPCGESERCISHFSYSVSQSMEISYFSRELPLFHLKEKVGSNTSVFYDQYIHHKVPVRSIGLWNFLQDVTQAKLGDIVIILSSAASGRKDFVLEYEDKDSPEISNSFSDQHRLAKVRQIVHEAASDTFYRSATEKDIRRSFSIEENTIGLMKANSLLKTVREKTKADILALHINIQILTGDDDTYYSALTSVCNMIHGIKSLYNH